MLSYVLPSCFLLFLCENKCSSYTLTWGLLNRFAVEPFQNDQTGIRISAVILYVTPYTIYSSFLWWQGKDSWFWMYFYSNTLPFLNGTFFKLSKRKWVNKFWAKFKKIAKNMSLILSGCLNVRDYWWALRLKYWLFIISPENQHSYFHSLQHEHAKHQELYKNSSTTTHCFRFWNEWFPFACFRSKNLFLSCFGKPLDNRKLKNQTNVKQIKDHIKTTKPF